MREEGIIKSFNSERSIGTISRSGSRDVAITIRSLAMVSDVTLEEGKRVSFTIVAGPKGPEARDIETIS
jgi:cold shock protein